MAASCEPYEITAALFINFKNFAGRDISFWDETALCACVSSCSIFDCTMAAAAERGWCSTELAAAVPADYAGITLAEVIKIVRDLRNKTMHSNLLEAT